jgi:selenocysteine lyase/cysteine desulfurase
MTNSEESMQETRRDFLKTAGKAAAVVGAMSALPKQVSAALANGSDNAFWRSVRESFGIDPQLHYHNIGGTGAVPRHVVANYDLYNRTIMRDPNASYNITQMRADVAPGFGANPDEIVLTTNTTDGMCMSLNGTDWAAGDEIISTNAEHPGGNGPMSHVAARKGVIIRRALLPVGADAQPQDFINAFSAQLTSRTKAICFSHIPYLTGALLPAKALCAWARDRNLLSIIDGAHVPGMINVNFHDMGVDLYAGSGHKWQCGPHGTGIWYVRNGMYPSNSRPLPMVWGVLTSGNAVTSRFAADGSVRNIGSFLQSHGHSNEPEWQALTDSCKFWDAIGRQKIDDYLTGPQGLSTELKRRVVAQWGRAGLMNSDHPDLISGITTINPFRVKNDTAKMSTLVSRMASEYNITTALRTFPTPTGGTLTSVRVSTHLFHNYGDLDYVMNAIMALAPQIDV